MGTKAVFSINFSRDPKAKIIGATYDGFPENLKSLAEECFTTAKKLRLLTKFKNNDPEAISKVMEYITCQPGSQWFTDEQKNAQWVSYSAILRPKTGTVTFYYGMYDSVLQELKIV